MVVSNNLIGISGKIGSGKDLLFDIINYLAVENDWNSFEHYMYECHITEYENKKFAYPIKWIVAVLIGCDIRQLEDREFKNKELGEEWRIWQVSYDTERHLFSDKKEAEKMCDEIWDHTDFIETFLLTPRKLLQLLGTEAGRQIIHPNIWVNALFADYNPLGFDYKGSVGKKIKGSWVYPNWIITDVRFPNEAKIIKDKGGILIRVNRDNGTRAIDVNPHPSETALDDYSDFDYVIENDGTVQDLIDKVIALNIVQKIS